MVDWYFPGVLLADEREGGNTSVRVVEGGETALMAGDRLVAIGDRPVGSLRPMLSMLRSSLCDGSGERDDAGALDGVCLQPGGMIRGQVVREINGVGRMLPVELKLGLAE